MSIEEARIELDLINAILARAYRFGPTVARIYTAEVEAARRALAAAGYGTKQNDGWYVPAGWKETREGIQQ